MATASLVPQDQTIVEFDVRTDEMLVNMGPQHPSTHGVLRLVLRTDGEIISEVVPHLGYLHRCAEKIGENVLPIQFIPYTDRMDYLAGMNMNLGYSLAVEKLCGMKIPEKANAIRVIVCELNRIASHLVAMGTYGLDLGTFSPFLYAFREREMILDLFEEVCGARLTYSYITVGGAHDDFPDGWTGRCQTFLNYLKERIPEYHTLLTRNQLFIRRTAGIGIMKYATAQGSHRVELPKHLPAGEAYVETECPRGQMGFYVVGSPAKSLVPLRVRARSSSFSNLSVTNPLCKGCLIADVPAIVG